MTIRMRRGAACLRRETYMMTRIAGLRLCMTMTAALLITACSRPDRGGGVRIEKVTTRDLVAMVTASGRIQPQRKVDISADITGRITALNVEEGDWVKAGTLVVQIEPNQFEAAVTRAEAALAGAQAEEARAQATRDQSKRTMERNEALRRENANLISDEALEIAQRDYEVNEALHQAATYRVAQARASLKEAQDQLAKTQIRAPMSGRVTRVAVEVGEVAVPGTFSRETALLLTISDLSVIQAVVEVDETDVVRISPGDSAAIEIDAFPDLVFTGRVTRISNSAILERGVTQSVDQAVDFEVEITLDDPPANVLPDLSATAQIITDTRTAALAVPIIALTVRDGGSASDWAVPAPHTGDVEGVFVIRDDIALFLPLTIGITGEEHFEVLAGLSEGESIVAGPYQVIRDLASGTASAEIGTASRTRPGARPGS